MLMFFTVTLYSIFTHIPSLLEYTFVVYMIVLRG